uniref:Response regulatory domain-containing protein n=1 Tax=Physcomitrium patens TaxID=3218 RepID=A0A2K1JH51_PHYPA|nr:hypothetical protein PHYPA_018281 [Physcomitrium patens]
MATNPGRQFESLRKHFLRRTGIVALTINEMASEMQKSLNVGMTAFLAKPTDQEYMVRVIQVGSSCVDEKKPSCSIALFISSETA